MSAAGRGTTWCFTRYQKTDALVVRACIPVFNLRSRMQPAPVSSLRLTCSRALNGRHPPRRCVAQLESSHELSDAPRSGRERISGASDLVDAVALLFAVCCNLMHRSRKSFSSYSEIVEALRHVHNKTVRFLDGILDRG